MALHLEQWHLNVKSEDRRSLHCKHCYSQTVYPFKMCDVARHHDCSESFQAWKCFLSIIKNLYRKINIVFRINTLPIMWFFSVKCKKLKKNLLLKCKKNFVCLIEVNKYPYFAKITWTQLSIFLKVKQVFLFSL